VKGPLRPEAPPSGARATMRLNWSRVTKNRRPPVPAAETEKEKLEAQLEGVHFLEA